MSALNTAVMGVLETIYELEELANRHPGIEAKIIETLNEASEKLVLALLEK